MPSGLKVTLGLFVSIVIVLGIIASFYFGTDLPEDQLNGLLRKNLESKYGIKTTIGRLHRKFWPTLRASDITLSFSREGRWHEIGHIQSVEVGYDLRDLLRGRWRLSSLYIEGAEIVLEKDSEGRLILPPKSESDNNGGGEGGFPSVEIAKLELREGSLLLAGPGSTSDFRFINLRARLRSEADTFLMDIDSFSFRLPSKEFTLERLSGNIKITGELVSVKDLRVTTAESNLTLNGNLSQLSSPRFSFLVKGERFSFGELSKFIKPDLSGLVSVEGEVSGDLKQFGGQAVIDGDFQGKRFERVKADYSYSGGRVDLASIQGGIFEAPISGSGYLDLSARPEAYGFRGRTKHLNLVSVISGELESDFSGRLKLEGRGLTEREMEMRISCDLEAGSIDRYSFSGASGDMIITTQKLEFLSGFEVGYMNSQVVLGGYLEYEGRINLSGYAELGDLDDFDGQFFLTDVGGRARGEFHLGGETQDFNIRGFLRSDSCWAYGFHSSNLGLELALDNFLSHKRGRVHIHSGEGSAWSVPVTEMRAFIGVDGDLFEFDSVAVKSGDLKVELAGRLVEDRVPREVQLKYLNLFLHEIPIYSHGQQRILLGEEEVEFKRCEFTVGGGQLSISGKLSKGQTLEVAVNGEGIDIFPVSSFFLPSLSLLGELSFGGEIKGSFESPEVSSTVRIDSLRLEGVEMGTLSLDLSYRNRLLDFPHIRLKHPVEDYSGSGFIGVNSPFGGEKLTPQERPLGFFLQARGEQLSMLSSLVGELEYLFGDFQADVVVSGTVKHPQFEGRLNLNNGVLKLADFWEPISNMEMALRLEDNIIHMEGISGKLQSQATSTTGLFRRLWGSVFPGKEKVGTIRLSGTIEVLDLKTFNYDLVVSGRDVPLTHAYLDLSSVSDFDLTLKGSSPPTVAGKVYIKQLLYQEPFTAMRSTSRELPSAVDSTSWGLDLEVVANNNIWIKNADLNAEFRSTLNVRRQLGQYQILGELEAIRGSAFIYGNRFDIVSGKMNFDNITKIDPQLDFETEIRTYYSGREEFSQGERTYSVYITGTLSAPQLGFAVGGDGSQREMSQQEVLESIALNRSPSGDTVQVSYNQALGDRAQGIFSGYLTKYFEAQAATALGVETFLIRTPTNHGLDLGDTEVTVGQYVSPNVYLRYSRRLSSTSAQEIAAEYRLSRRLSLEGKYDKDRFFHFDLSMNWEF
jgi:hypothetical protein